MSVPDQQCQRCPAGSPSCSPQIEDLQTKVGWGLKTVESRVKAVERVILSMHQRLGCLLTLQDMAAISQLSAYHFSRVFSHVTGVSPCRFLAALRVEEAKRLLLRTQLSATEVCFEVGYNSLGTFTTNFTQLVGISPSRLRRLGDSGLADLLADLHAYGHSGGAPRSTAAMIQGHVQLPEAFSGLIFVGLFPDPIPQGQPVGCDLLSSPGRYQIGAVPDGRYWLFGSALAHTGDPLTYLLPTSDNHWVGLVNKQLLVRDGRVRGDTNLMLRRCRLTDPPILSVLPILLQSRQDELLEREIAV
jgi:AraC-like DNA-binding protein